MGLVNLINASSPHEEHMLCIQHNIPLGNNYAKLHKLSQKRLRTKLRLHGIKPGYAYSKRRKYWQKSICRNICVMQSIVEAKIKELEELIEND